MSLLVALLLAAPASASSLERVADDVTRAVSSAGFEGPIGVYVEGAPAPLARATVSLVSAALAQKRLAPVPVTARDATEAERLAREQGLRALVRLTLALEAPKLVVRGDALSTWVNFWSGATPTRTGPATAIASAVDADLEVLTLAGAPSPAAPRPLELALGVLTRTQGLPAAMTVADVDGDRHAELIALVGDAVHTWSAEGRLRARVELSTPLATRPTREPFGWLSFSNGKLLAWSSRRERAELFVWQGGTWKSAGTTEPLTAGALTLSVRPGFESFARELSWSGRALTWPEPVTQVAVFGAVALGVGPTGNAALSRGQAPTTLLSGVGCGSTLADLDADGTPEVIVTSSRSSGDGDELRVLALGAFESAQARGGNVAEASATWQRKLEGRIVLAAAGDLDGDGADEVVLGSWLGDATGEFLVLRRTP